MDQKEKHKIDFRVSRLTHSVVKEAEHLRVQELVKRIETHPHRAALHADLKQNNVYNPFSKDLKEMIRDWVMWSYWSFAKQHQKYNILTSLLELRICVLHLRTMLDLQRIQKKF